VDFELHSSNTSIHYWKSEGKDPKDVHRLREEIVRCSPNGKGKMATGDGISYDEENGKSAGASTLNGKRVGQLLCGEVTHMKFMEWRRYSDIEMWQSEGREILETNENVLPSAHLQQNHASDLNLSIKASRALALGG